MLRTRVVGALLLVGALLVAGCAGGGTKRDAGHVAVVAAFYPLLEITVRVGGDRVSVTNLTPAGAEPHDLELNPDQVDAIANADVVFYLGKGFQPAVQKAVANNAVDLLLDADRREGAEVDPHIWLDPQHTQAMIERVRTALTQADPAGSDLYQRNADAYLADVRALDTDMSAGLAHCDRRSIVTAHAAFGYLATRFGLVQHPITGIDPETEPDPRKLAELSDLVRHDGTTTIFTETLVSPAIAQTLAREAHVKTAVLNPLEGLSKDEIKAGATYISVMRDNLATLRAALGCT